ncbi:MAG: MmcQ/YjbR family DNA-binding protein [Actinomycetes bacterium]
MATWDDVARICLALPDTAERPSYGGARSWRVRNKPFVWERPLRRKDLAELGDGAPTGPVLAASVPDEGAKAALVADEPDVYFTTSHFDGYPAVLCRLGALDEQSLDELVTEAWACRAPRRLLAQLPTRPR